MNSGFLDGTLVALALFAIGVYGLLARHNIIKTIMSFGIVQAAIILFFLNINYTLTLSPPIGDGSNMADPFPQALMITAIVIGVAVTAVGLTMFMSLYHHYGSTNWVKIQKMRKERK
ncbi:MAG: cation:proton antiporter subunit C [Erysipelotrichaceae bacterium]|nr:cation:proton antiporter subunit C [Erysipelotrichaceae bacterium]MDD3810081.1 cation:proton antiporter subunit C [Erysipelotrichaceae bacterium]